MHKLYHFTPARPVEDVVLSTKHKLPGKVAQFLTNFQIDGVRFLYQHFENHKACILNDESGLGKTVLVSAFLEAVLPKDGSKKCLIVSKDENQIEKWKFHIDVLTKWKSKVIQCEEDIGPESVFLIKYDALRNSSSLSETTFDCFIIDIRGDISFNKNNRSYLLKHFENKISLIISSTDITLDIKRLHAILRLCGRLDPKYVQVKTFEEKFDLPVTVGRSDDQNILEAYFQKREIIINYCREFRLRRYRHQFEDDLLSASPETFQNSLKEWLQNPLRCSLSLSSGSCKIISSSLEQDTDEFFRKYYGLDSENANNKEVESLTSTPPVDVNKEIVDDVQMSPLLFESDSEEEYTGELEELHPKKNVSNKKTTAKAPPKKTAKKPQETTKKKLEKANSESKKCKIRPLALTRSMCRVTRSKAKNNKMVSLGTSILDEYKTYLRKKRNRLIARNPKVKKTEKVTGHTANFCEVQKPKSPDKPSASTIKKQKKDVSTKRGSEVFHKKSLNHIKLDVNKDSMNRKELPESGNSSELRIFSSGNSVICLTSSNENSIPKPAPKTIQNLRSGYVSPSPELFENIDEFEILCTQRNRSTFGFKVFGSEIRETTKKSNQASCLETLENNINNRGHPINISEDANIFGLTTKSNLEVDSLPFKNRTNGLQRNKITKYLIGNEIGSQSFDISPSSEIIEFRRSGEQSLITPNKRHKLSQKSLGSTKKSPKSSSSRTVAAITPNSLTNWLIKPNSPKVVTKPSKRRRLDVCFSGLK